MIRLALGLVVAALLAVGLASLTLLVADALERASVDAVFRTQVSFRLRNLPHRIRGIKQELYHWLGLGNLSTLSAVIIKADGTRIDLGVVGRRVITTAGVNYLASCFNNTAEPEAFNFHAMGTGAVAEAIGDTALGTQVESRVSGTQSVSTNVYQTVATITATAARAITEHGLFSASSAGTLLDRTVFAVNNLAINDGIQFTYSLTLAAGG